jgi:hypothetical protein
MHCRVSGRQGERSVSLSTQSRSSRRPHTDRADLSPQRSSTPHPPPPQNQCVAPERPATPRTMPRQPNTGRGNDERGRNSESTGGATVALDWPPDRSRTYRMAIVDACYPANEARGLMIQNGNRGPIANDRATSTALVVTDQCASDRCRRGTDPSFSRVNPVSARFTSDVAAWTPTSARQCWPESPKAKLPKQHILTVVFSETGE